MNMTRSMPRGRFLVKGSRQGLPAYLHLPIERPALRVNRRTVCANRAQPAKPILSHFTAGKG